MLDRFRIIKLISITTASDSIGQQVQTETQREVLCRLRSVSRNEWSQAGQLGITSEYQATLRATEYNGEEYVITGGKKYHVYRTYDAGDSVELYLEEMVGHGGQG